MADAITPITRQFSVPYLTLDEFKNAPTALDYGNLVQGGSSSAQDAELTNAITRASSWIDQWCNQVLGATSDTEQQRVRLKADGTIRFHPKYFPVVALTNLAWGMYPNQLTTAPDCSTAWLEEQEIIYPYATANTTWSSQGPLSLGFPSSARAETYIQYTYVNGYANTTVGSTATAGNTSIVVSDPTGIVAGQDLMIYDGIYTENVHVSTTYVLGSTTVGLQAPLGYNHAVGVSVSALPAAVKQAAILMTSAYLKIRGDASLVLAVTNRPGEQITGSQGIGTDVAHAKELLAPFRRIR